MDLDGKFLSLNKQLLANMGLVAKEPDKYIVLKTCLGASLLMAIIWFGVSYLFDMKRDNVDQFILKHGCKPVEVIRVDAIKANIIYHCGDGKQLEVTL